MKKYRIIIGVDPDCGKEPDADGINQKGGNGMAVYDRVTRSIAMQTLLTAQLIDAVRNIKDDAGKENIGKDEILIVVEASWQSKTVWHCNHGEKATTAARKGYDVGRCHQTGKIIVELLRHEGYDVQCVAPLRKHWKGQDGKISHEELSRLIHLDKKRSNQEERDAALLAMNMGHHPMRLSTQPL